MIDKLTEFKEAFNSLEKKAEKAKEIAFYNLVDWNHLTIINIGETVVIGDIKIKKTHQGEFCMQFISIVPPLSIFPYHWHDFFELNILLDGQISDNGVTFYKGDCLKINSYKTHEFVNTSTTKQAVISTTFTKFECNFLIK
jgi:hypothetical protein